MSDFSTIVARVIDSCQKQKQNSGTTHTSSAMVQRHARHHLRVANGGRDVPPSLWEPVAEAAYRALTYPSD